MSDIENVLANAERASTKDTEIARILSCNNKDYFAILEIDPKSNANEMELRVKKAYRTKSLLIHPDKTDNPDAPRAFEVLNRAKKILGVATEEAPEDSEERKSQIERQRLLDIYNHVFTESITTQDKIQQRVSTILNNEERDAEEADRAMKEKEAQQLQQFESRKQELQMKRQLESQWEDLRDTRVKNWRDFTGKIEKKKKKIKKKLLA